MHFTRALALLAVLGFSFLGAGCSGSSTATPPLPLQSGDASSIGPSTGSAIGSSRSAATITVGSTNTLVGKVIYSTYFASSGGFEVNGGSGVGYVWIYTNSSTKWTYNGLTLKVGDYVTATGTWSTSTRMNATSATLGTSGTLGFVSSTPTTTTTTTTTGTAGVPQHVQTAEYLWTSTETSTSPSRYAPYLSWAYALNSRLGMTQAAGIKTVLYTSPVMPNSNTYEYNTLNSTYASARATTCTGTLSRSYSGTGLLSDPTHSATASYFTNVFNHVTSVAKTANPGYSHPWDLIFIDNAGPLYGVSPMPCNYSTATWNTAFDNAVAATGQQVIVNTLSVADQYMSGWVSRLKGSNIAGGEYEECYTNGLWTSEEDAQLQTIALLKSEGKKPGAGFWCYADNVSGAGASSIPQRMFIYASFLLTYNPSYSVFQESFSTPSTFKVFPETGFVPEGPASTPISISGLANGGVYVQRYSSCYYRGVLKGGCEIVVNPNGSTASVPNLGGYHHSMVLSGAGVLDGGTASFGGSVPSSLAPKTAAILVP